MTLNATGDSEGQTAQLNDRSGVPAPRGPEEADWRENQRKLLAAQRLAKIGLWEWVEGANVVYWSDECYEMWGRSRETFSPTYEAWLDSIHEDDRQHALKAVAELHPAFEFRIVRPDGTVRWIYAESEAEVHQTGPARRFGINQDITARKMIELALEESQRNLQEAQRMACMGYFERDLRTGVTTWSNMMYEIMGLSPDTFVPTVASTIQLVHPEDRARFRTAVQSHAAVEFRVIKPNGEIRHFFGVGNLQHSADGKPLRVFGFRQDITERKESERQFKVFERELRQRQKLESLGQLAGGIAHEFNNMLQAILTGTRQALRGVEADHAIRPDLELVLTAARRAKHVVADVLRFAHSEPAPRQPYRISTLLRSSLDFARHGLPSSVRLVEDIPSYNQQASVGGTEFAQIITNLINNAVDALRGQGTISVSLRVVEDETEEPRASRFQITIEDDGCGMDEATLARAFDPFFTTKAPGRGTGLGLSIVYGIISGWEGRISASSRVGAGSTFSISLPVIASGDGQDTAG